MIEIDQEFEISKAYIKVKIVRSAQRTLDNSKSDITGFKIVDNRIGFNSKNYKSFQTLDSEYKIVKRCRGVNCLQVFGVNDTVIDAWMEKKK